MHFQAAENAFVLETARLDAPLPHRDAMLLGFIRAHTEHLQGRFRQHTDDPELERIQTAIQINAETGEYSAEALADTLGMSLRTLQRAVSRHSTSVRDLLDSVREESARKLLRCPEFSVDEVAALLGYSTAGAFRRAFTRWTGQSPSQASRSRQQ